MIRLHPNVVPLPLPFSVPGPGETETVGFLFFHSCVLTPKLHWSSVSMCDDTLLSHAKNDNAPKVQQHDRGV